jgi:hypothetical protein
MRLRRSSKRLCLQSEVVNLSVSQHLITRGELFSLPHTASYDKSEMAFPIKVCTVCNEEFELKPDKPGFANRCPECSVAEETELTAKRRMDADERRTASEANEARRKAMRDLLYRKES